MLHAILHGKLDHLTPEPQRLEDGLTSTVFGTLALVEASRVLLRWLTGGDESLLKSAGNADLQVWFWPRLRTKLLVTVPDVLVRIGGVLFVVEAKYTSWRHDLRATDGEGPEDVRDQLFRQHICILARPDERPRYAEDLELALEECRAVHIYLVDGRRTRRARREYAESRTRAPSMDLRLRTWQELDRVLSELSPRCRWVQDVRRYLALTGLDSFLGFGYSGLMPAAIGDRCRAWRGRLIQSGLCRAIESFSRDSAQALGLWRVARRKLPSLDGFVGATLSRRLPTALTPIMSWRADRASTLLRRSRMRFGIRAAAETMRRVDCAHLLAWHPSRDR